MPGSLPVQVWLSDILKAAGLARQFTVGLSYDEYLASPLHVSAVERQLSIIGEAVVQIRNAEPDAPLSGLRGIAGFRNILVHRYARVSQAVVWAVLVDELPVLEREAAAWLVQLDAQAEL